jgi:hypothetical protein
MTHMDKAGRKLDPDIIDEIVDMIGALDSLAGRDRLLSPEHSPLEDDSREELQGLLDDLFSLLSRIKHDYDPAKDTTP